MRTTWRRYHGPYTPHIRTCEFHSGYALYPTKIAVRFADTLTTVTRAPPLLLNSRSVAKKACLQWKLQTISQWNFNIPAAIPMQKKILVHYFPINPRIYAHSWFLWTQVFDTRDGKITPWMFVPPFSRHYNHPLQLYMHTTVLSSNTIRDWESPHQRCDCTRFWSTTNQHTLNKLNFDNRRRNFLVMWDICLTDPSHLFRPSTLKYDSPCIPIGIKLAQVDI